MASAVVKSSSTPLRRALSGLDQILRDPPAEGLEARVKEIFAQCQEAGLSFDGVESSLSIVSQISRVQARIKALLGRDLCVALLAPFLPYSVTAQLARLNKAYRTEVAETLPLIDYLDGADISTILRAPEGRRFPFKRLNSRSFEQLTDAQLLGLLTRCPELIHFNLRQCRQLTLASLSTLRPIHINLSLTTITDADLNALLAVYAGLQSLMVSSCSRLTGAGLVAALERHPELKRLDVSNLLLTDADLEALVAHSSKLQSLQLLGCEALTTLKPLAGCASLTAVDLTSCDKIPEGDIIEMVQRHPGLISLDVEQCSQLTDRFLDALIALKLPLKQLGAFFCPKISPEGKARFRLAYPATSIEFSE